MGLGGFNHGMGQMRTHLSSRTATVMMAAGNDFEVKDGAGGQEFREKETMNLS